MSRHLARIFAAAIAVFAVLAGAARAADFAEFAVISNTMGMNGGRLCSAEASRGDIGCPSYAPSLTTAGHVSVTGNLSAAKFIGDGSGLTGLNAGAGDRISTSGVVSGANLGMVVASQGTVSFTTGGVAGTAYLTTAGLLVGPGISATTNQSSFTTIYASGRVGVGLSAPSTTLTVSGTTWAATFVHQVQLGLAAPISQSSGGGGSGTPGGSDTYVQYNSGGTFAGSSAFTWNNGTSTLTATNIAGTLATAAQPNITSLGTLGALTVTGAGSIGSLGGVTTRK